jgi:hypothetical protein
MDRTAGFEEVLRRLAIIDESFAEDQAGLRLDLPGSQLLDPKAAALVQMGALVVIGAPGVCLEWGTTRALRVTGRRSAELAAAVTERTEGWPAGRTLPGRCHCKGEQRPGPDRHR